MHATASKPDSEQWWGRLQKLMNEGYRPMPGSAGHLHISARESMLDALRNLAPTGPDPNHSGAWRAQFGSPILQDVAECLLTEKRAFFLPDAPDLNDQNTFPMYKLKMQVDFHLDLARMQYADLNVPARQMMKELDARVKKDGWDPVKKGLIALIKGLTFSGCMYVHFCDYGRALQYLRYTVAIIEEANVLWKGVPYEVRGQTYRPTFVRGVRVRLMEAILEGYGNVQGRAARINYKLEEVLSLARGIIEDCKTDDYDLLGNTTWLGFHTMAISRARASMGAVYCIQAREKARTLGKLTLYDSNLMKKAAIEFKKAAKILPDDMPEKPTYLYSSLACTLYGGGATVREILTEAEMCEAALSPPELIFGPSTRDDPPRIFARTQLDLLRGYVDNTSAGPRSLEKLGKDVMKPVGSVDISSVPSHLTGEARSDAIRALVSNKIWKSLPGTVKQVAHE